MKAFFLTCGIYDLDICDFLKSEAILPGFPLNQFNQLDEWYNQYGQCNSDCVLGETYTGKTESIAQERYIYYGCCKDE